MYMSLASAMDVINLLPSGVSTMEYIIIDWYVLMIAVFGGFCLTLFLGRANVPKQPLRRLIVALLLVTYFSALYFSETQILPMSLAVLGFAAIGVGFRSFMELCLRDRVKSEAIEEAIRRLSTAEERTVTITVIPHYGLKKNSGSAV